MGSIKISLKKELCIEEGYQTSLLITDKEISSKDREAIYLRINNGHVYISIDSIEEELEDSIAIFCDGVFCSTDNCRSTGGQIPAVALNPLRENLDLILKPEFFDIDIEIN